MAWHGMDGTGGISRAGTFPLTGLTTLHFTLRKWARLSCTLDSSRYGRFGEAQAVKAQAEPRLVNVISCFVMRLKGVKARRAEGRNV